LQTQVREDFLDHWLFEDRRDDLQLAAAVRAVRRNGTPQRQHFLAGAWAEGDALRTGGGLQRPEYAGLVRIGVVVGHVGLALLFDEHPLAGEQLTSCG